MMGLRVFLRFIINRQSESLSMKKINYLLLILVMLIACAPSVHRAQYDKAQATKERWKRKPGPKVDYIFNDTQLGRLYNGGKKFSDSGFRKYVAAHISKGLRVRFVSGKNLFGKKYIRYAVIFLMEIDDETD